MRPKSVRVNSIYKERRALGQPAGYAREQAEAQARWERDQSARARKRSQRHNHRRDEA